MAEPTKPKAAPAHDNARGARPDAKPGMFDGLGKQHRKVARETLRRLIRQPIGSLMICLVIGISLALPATLMALLGNLQHVVGEFDDVSRLTVYLKLDIPEAKVRALTTSLGRWSEIREVTWISRVQALEDFRQSSGLGQALDYLDHNPLPDTLLVSPMGAMDAAALEGLLTRLEALPEVDQVQVDLLWLQRLAKLAEVLERGAWALGAMLAITVLLVTGNTIRLAIENRREEIVVLKLVGGTDGFVRRPFLYTGAMYGFAGGLLALLLVGVVFFLLNGPVRELAATYNTRFELNGPGFEGALWVLLSGVLLGWAGAWLSVKRHLHLIEPA